MRYSPQLPGVIPPLEGSLPTRYSPVRRSTWGLLPFRARLACVRHAASVDSEPGSNSPVKLVTPWLKGPFVTEETIGPRAEPRSTGLRAPSFQRATPFRGLDQNTKLGRPLSRPNF